MSPKVANTCIQAFQSNDVNSYFPHSQTSENINKYWTRCALKVTGTCAMTVVMLTDLLKRWIIKKSGIKLTCPVTSNHSKHIVIIVVSFPHLHQIPFRLCSSSHCWSLRSRNYLWPSRCLFYLHSWRILAGPETGSTNTRSLWAWKQTLPFSKPQTLSHHCSSWRGWRWTALFKIHISRNWSVG